jgi:dTDP-4-amino-4,6-dideoxygalactose transaminase
MSVVLLDLNRQRATLRAELDQAVARVIDSQHFIMGPEVSLFEKEAAAYLAVKHAVACASGSDALLLALWALGVGPGREVITTPFTFFATAGAIARLGARPVFVDIDEDTLNLDPSQVASAVTPRTAAIVPVHLFGLPADMDALSAIGDRRGVAIVEDAAQSMGATHRGRQTGSIGDAGCFSFFPSKNLGCWGDGGMVTTQRDDLALAMRKLRTHGSERKYQHDVVGMNSRLDALQAAVLRVKLPHLSAWCDARRQKAANYGELVAARGIGDRVRFQSVPGGSTHVYHQMVIRVENRDAVQKALEGRGIGTAIYYPSPLHLQACFADLGHRPGAFPHAEQACREALALPIFPELTDREQHEVVDALADALG